MLKFKKICEVINLLRIIAGELKGKKLFSVKGLRLRPTAERVREAIFNILQGRVQGKKVLDLFAGTGAWGLEALSRGAASAIFVEYNPHILKALRRNIKECHLETKSAILPCDVGRGIRILAARGEVFDLIFLDPPYARGLVKETLKDLGQTPLVSPQGLIIAEHSLKEDLSTPLTWELIDRRQYGTTRISFWRLSGE